MNVLIVDDSKMVRNLLKTMVVDYFEKKGFGNPFMLFAENGVEAMEHMKLHRVDFMFLDYNMPLMTGEEVVEAVRANKGWRSTRIIMATTEGSKATVMRLMKKGVNSYIVKPFVKESIIKKLDILIARIPRCKR